MPGLDWLTARPVAHRGLHDARSGVIENSESAVRAAIDADYAIEVDIQRTADDQALVFHDFDLGRLTEETGPVAGLALHELEAVALSGSSNRLMSLDRLLETVAGRVPLVVEIKSAGDGDTTLVERLAERVGDYPGRLAAMSFDPAVVAALRDRAPFLTRGLISYRYDDDHARLLPAGVRFRRRHLFDLVRAAPHFIAYDCQGLPALAPLVARRVFGMPLLSWTVRDAETQRRIARHVDQIIFEGFVPE